MNEGICLEVRSLSGREVQGHVSDVEMGSAASAQPFGNGPGAQRESVMSGIALSTRAEPVSR